MKEIWSDRYGKNPKEGLHCYLEKNVMGYKRQNLTKYVKGFASYIGKPDKRDTVYLCQGNFNKWTEFIKTIT